ncbi:hypothetical protein ACXJJ3_42305 (plasmid) [Kribbella sp. WER1]
MDAETKSAIRPEATAWPTLIFGVVLTAGLNLMAIGSTEGGNRWHLAGAVVLPAFVLVGAIGWNVPWPARILRTGYTIVLGLLLFANVTTFYPRSQAVIAAIGYPVILSYAVAPVGTLLMTAGLAGMWPGGTVRPQLFKIHR